MEQFSFMLPQKIIFGEGSIEKIVDCIDAWKSKKVLVLSGRVLQRIGTVKKVTDKLEMAGIAYAVFVDIEANPSVETVEKATRVFQEEEADALIALGGGSPMDVAKAVSVLASHGGQITDYEGADKIPGEVIPMAAIPTTAGTGSEVTAFSVITDKQRNYKLTIYSSKLLPEYALLDPELLCSAPAGVAAATGVDALVHSIEAYLSLAANPFTDAMAEKAMELLGGNMKKFVANRQNKAAASAMLLGSTFAGIAFAQARLGDVHAMAHPLGGFFDVPHGVANAILLPTVLEFNALADAGRYEKIYRCITGKPCAAGTFEPEMLVEEIRQLLKALRLPATLKDVGAEPEKIPLMAEDAMKSGNILVNPRQTTKADIERLYEKAFS